MSEAPLASVQPEPPERFGRYTLLRRIATGGMAEIFLALQRSAGHDFEKLLVVKRILPEMNGDRMFVDMLMHEAKIAATFGHPNVVSVFDAGKIEGRYFIAMEHVHGEDLRAIVRQMKRADLLAFPLEHALAIVLGACAGLAYAHQRRSLDGEHLAIVHRDVSPQNIVVTYTGDVKVIDFGIARSDARRDEEQTKSGKLKGKVPYMSPEQARGEPLDARSDLFSLGTILFELTTGKRLFKGQSEFETLKLICDRDYPRPSEVKPDYPPGLEPIVMKALAKDRERRYASGQELQADLEAFIREQRLAVSRLSLEGFMRTLFADQLAREEAALREGKRLAEVLAQAIPEPPETSGALELSAVQRVERPRAAPAPAPAATARSWPLLVAAIALILAVLLLLAR